MKKYTDEEMSKMDKEASDMRKQNQKMSWCKTCNKITKQRIDDTTLTCTECNRSSKITNQYGQELK